VKRRNSYRILVENVEGKRSLGRPKCSKVDKIKIDHIELQWGCVP
jgi:hypothetical protein